VAVEVIRPRVGTTWTPSTQVVMVGLD
jgi:hypothetical protein